MTWNPDMSAAPWHKTFVEIDYTNWRGERRNRVITPIKLTWGASEYHPGDQWVLLAMDNETKTTKEFAMSGIHGWHPLAPPQDSTP